MIACPALLLFAAISWIHEGPRVTFTDRNGEISTSGAGNQQNWFRSSAEYENLKLRFEYKLAQWAEAAIILRAPRAGRPMNAGIALVLAHDFHNDLTPYITGGIAGAVPPLKRLPASCGTWHKVDITLDGDRLRASIDDTVVQDIALSNHPTLRDKLRRGFIGFPDLGHAYLIRNVQVQDLGNRNQIVELGNPAGWKLRGEGTWTAHDGIITGANGHGILYAPPVFRDFELTMLVRSHNRVNAGVFLRGSPDLKEHRGFEVQIYSPPDAVYPTGSVYAKQRSRISADYEEKWFLMQILVGGDRCRVRIDGDEVADYSRLSGPDRQPGRIGLQIHMENASVDFRDLRVRPLTRPAEDRVKPSSSMPPKAR